MTFVGSHLWQSNDNSISNRFEIYDESGNEFGGPVGGRKCIASDGVYLYVGEWGNRRIWKVRVPDGAVVEEYSVDSPAGSLPLRITYHDGAVWSATAGPSPGVARLELKRVDGGNGRAAQFVGGWKNQDLSTGGLTRIEVDVVGDDIEIQEWGKCHPSDCYWGSVSTPVSGADDNSLSLTWSFSFATVQQTLTVLSDGRLQVRSNTHFTDSSGRADHSSLEYFVRALMGKIVAADLAGEQALVSSYYPNPFNTTVTVSFRVNRAGVVRIEIFDLTGRRIKTLEDGFHRAGLYDVTWNGIDDRGGCASSGTYFVRAQCGEHSLTGKITLLK
jgi:hypothetical protein